MEKNQTGRKEGPKVTDRYHADPTIHEANYSESIAGAGMKFIIELDGVVFDTDRAHYDLYCAVVDEIGWSRLDGATYRRLTRTKGLDANLLPAAKPAKIKEFHRLFAERLEADLVIAAFCLHEDCRDTLERLAKAGACLAVSLGQNTTARQNRLSSTGLSNFFLQLVALEGDPRRRPAQLRALGGAEKRTVAVASTDAVVRVAREAELFTVGVASGICSVARLHQAGADIVYREIAELADSISEGGRDLVAAGLLPAPLS